MEKKKIICMWKRIHANYLIYFLRTAFVLFILLTSFQTVGGPILDYSI